MARLVYASRFEIKDIQFETLVSHYREWIERHYRERRNVELTCELVDLVKPISNLPSEHQILREEFSSENDRVLHLQWSQPDEFDNGFLWRNEVFLASIDGSRALEHLIWIDSSDYRVAPARITLGSPTIIRRLCSEHVVQVGEMQVRATPYALDSTRVPEFLELLSSPLRRLPIVFVAPYVSGNPSKLSPASLAQNLAGVAVVVEARNNETTWDIAEEIGRTLSCYNGGVRVYWPGFHLNDEPWRHPLFLASRIDLISPERVARAVQRTIFAVASFRYVTHSRILSIIRSAEEAQRLSRLEQQKTSGGLDWEQLAEEIDAEATTLRQRVEALEAENEILKANQQVFFASRELDDPAEVPGAEATEDAKTVAEVVKQARNFSDLVILPSALSAAEDSPFRRPAEIREALTDLDAVARELAEQRKSRKPGKGLLQKLMDRGWGKRCAIRISDTTRTRYRSDYTFEYEKKRQIFEPHINRGIG